MAGKKLLSPWLFKARISEGFAKFGFGRCLYCLGGSKILLNEDTPKIMCGNARSHSDNEESFVFTAEEVETKCPLIRKEWREREIYDSSHEVSISVR
ncbi:hypothetical protein MNBD_CPR01-39 [hydrothermal vent metagenome]|uniref:Uncharacterized protein n=1 Tax=hydrothermal vent metagenome TaxID=652676 RepID=A0A3B0ULR4_9ZZZZ